jgi:hypothetical protein
VAREKNPERKAFYQLAWHLTATARRIMEAPGTLLILGMTVIGIVSIGCVAVGCGYGIFKRPVSGGTFVFVLHLQADEFGCLGHPFKVIFLLFNIGRKKELHGTWRWIAQRLEQTGTHQNGDVVRIKA